MNIIPVDIIRKFIRNILPLPCPACRSNEADMPNGFCRECREKLMLYPESMQRCPGCGGMMTGALAVCIQCLAEPERPWQKAYSMMPYRGFARNLIRNLKFSKRPELARAFGMLLAENLRQNNISADLIVPVPLHFARQFSRGYNQSQLLADVLSSFCKIPVSQPLRRIRKRSHQSRRNRSDRHRELSGTFILTAPEKVKDRHILMIDDVFTTGATLHAAVKTVMDGSPASVTIITLARTPGRTL